MKKGISSESKSDFILMEDDEQKNFQHSSTRIVGNEFNGFYSTITNQEIYQKNLFSKVYLVKLYVLIKAAEHFVKLQKMLDKA